MPTELATDTVLSGTYRVIRTIGRGGMGEVYEVRHLRTKAALALKLLLTKENMPPQVFQRFRREAEVTSNLNHPNIVRVFDFDSLPDGRPFLVMELLEGRELTQLLEPRTPLPLPEVAAIIEQIAQGLSAAHERGVVHRDLKPSNVFLMTMPGSKRELVKLLDFGISKVRGGESNLTRTDAILGTPHYMSPEQASGRTDQADGRTDQFALASIAYEMLTGEMAFPGDLPLSVLYRVVHQHPPPLRSRVAALPAELENVVNRALAKNPEYRFPTVAAFAQAMSHALQGFAGVPSTGAPHAMADEQIVTSPLLDRAESTTLSLNAGQTADRADPKPTVMDRRRRIVVAVGVAATVGALVALRPWPKGRPPVNTTEPGQATESILSQPPVAFPQPAAARATGAREAGEAGEAGAPNLPSSRPTAGDDKAETNVAPPSARPSPPAPLQPATSRLAGTKRTRTSSAKPQSLSKAPSIPPAPPAEQSGPRPLRNEDL